MYTDRQAGRLADRQRTYLDESDNTLYAIFTAGCSRTLLNHPLTLYLTEHVFCKCDIINISGRLASVVTILVPIKSRN